MTTPILEKKVIQIEEGTNLIELRVEVGDILELNGKKEPVTFAYYEDVARKKGEIFGGRRLRIFRTARKEEGVIVEIGYTISSEGKLGSFFSGIYHEKDTPPFHASARYSELDKFLQEHKK